MSPRPPLVLAVTALVLLAGCSLPASQTTTATDSTADTTTGDADTTTTDADTTTAPELLAPGITGEGIVDRSALFDAHRTALLADGAVIVLNVSTTGGDGPELRTDSRVSLAPGGESAAVHGTGLDAEGQVQSVDAWLNRTLTVFRFGADGDTEYRVLERAAAPDELVWAGDLRAYVDPVAAAFAVTGVETRDGTRFATLAAEVDLVENASGVDTAVELVVDERGVVRSATVDQRQPDGQRHLLSYRVARLGTTGDRPPWVDRVPAGAFLDADLDAEVLDGTVLRLHNGGPDAVPAGTTVTVIAGGVAYDATLGAVAAGETRYLWVDDGGTLTASDDRPAAGSGRQLGGRAVVTVETADGVTLLTADLVWRDRGGR
jgi:hypothetical protein